MQSMLGSLKTRAIASLFAAFAVFATAPSMAAGPLESILEDFEAGNTSGAVAADPTNSSAGGVSNSILSNVSEGGSKRLRIQDPDGTYNGAVITIPNAIPMAGYYLITADVKVDNSTANINSFGMAAVAGGPVTSRVLDTSAGYVMNLTGSGDAGFGYQTIGASIQVPEGGTFPRDLTLYFSSDVSGNPNGPAADGDFNRTHRASATDAWAAGNSNAVYVDNIKRIGPGNIGEERHLWISVGDSYTNLNSLDTLLVSAKQNNFNVVDILARYRADAYYVPNRTITTYPNPEPLGTKVAGGTVSATNDPLQYAIDRGHELGIKVYISFSTFLVTDTATYPSTLPSGSIQWFYNTGTPRAMLSADAGSEGLWADPSRKDVRDYTKNVLMDIVSNYDFDGIIFDRCRYPGQNFSYNPTGLSQLGSTYGLVTSPLPVPTSTPFRDARREVIATFIQDCYTSITTTKPWMVVGATPVCTLDNMVDTYNQYFQYWPKWTSKKAPNRAISFGILDTLQPQFYRLNTSTAPYQAPGSNQRLMDKAMYGDTATLSSDYGLMPGSNISLAPLFYHPNTGDTGQSAANSQNCVDTRTRGLSGFGFFRAGTTLPDISMIRSTGNNTAGVDVLAQPSELTDYLQKANYDNVKPNGVMNLTAIAQANSTVILNWTAPALAIDGDGASSYLIYRSSTTPVKEYWANLITPTGVSGSATSFTVPAGVTGSYYYKVVAVDDYNNHGPAATKGPIAVNGTSLKPGDVIVDNPQATLAPSAASWTLGTSSTDKFGADYRNKGKGTGTATATFAGAIPQDGSWDVWEWHPAGTNRTTAATHKINSDGSPATAIVNQQINGGKWNKIGTGNFKGGTGYNVVIDDNFGTPLTGQVIMADAIRWSYSAQLAGTPTAPGGLSAVGYGSSTINLSWFDNANNETGYQVLRAQVSGGPYTVIANLAANSTAYTDLNLPGGNYYYVVRALNAAGNSLYSNESWAHVPVPAPSTPQALVANNSGCTSIHLEWLPIAEPGAATDQYVYRAMAPEGPFTSVAQIGPLNSMYDDMGLLNGSTYYYRVVSSNGDVNSVPSNTASASTPALPAVASDVTATAVSQTEISLSWTDNATNEAGYDVLRDGVVVDSLPSDSTGYIDSGLTADTHYSYKVRATSPCGPSSDSQAAEVQTLPNPPAAPTGLTATGAGGTQINLAWIDNADNEQAFEIVRNGNVIDVAAANATSYSDTGASECTAYTYTVRAYNAGGKSADSNQVSLSLDVTNPTITAPADVNVSNDAGVCSASNVALGTPATADNCSVASIASDAPATFSVGTTDVTWTVTDGHGNTATALQHVTVSDTEKPTVTAPANVVISTDAGQSYASNVSLGVATSADNCGVASTVSDAGAQFPIGTTVVTWTATDVHGNVQTATQSVTVEDHENPTITAPADVNVSNDAGVCGASGVALGTPTTHDNGSVASVQSNAPASFPVGTTNVTWTVTDGSGNSATAVQHVTVSDTEKPSITAPANIVASTDAGHAYATNVSLGTPTSADNCGVQSTGNNAPAQFAIGNTTVTWTVTDVHGNVQTATQTVTVQDHENPVIAPQSNISIGASLNALVPVTYGPIATDNAPGVTVVCVPPSGSGFPVGTTTVNVTATDASGNVSTSSFTVVRAALGFTGFASPIGGCVDQGTGGSFASPARIIKLGSTLPVKMNIRLNGAGVSTGVHTLQATKYDSAAAPGTPIDATPTDAATTGNQFRLTDAASGEWHFNLSTKSGFSQGTWKLVATLADGSKHEVWIDLK